RIAMALKMHASRKSSKYKSQTGRRWDQHNSPSAVRPISLSATGSMIAPIRVNCFKARAAIPSSTSVIMAAQKTASAPPMLPATNSQTKIGTASRRSAVRALGTFTSLLLVALLVPLRPGVVLVGVLGELLGLAGRAVGGDDDLHLLADQLFPLFARDFLGPRHLAARLVLAGGVDGHVLRHRDRAGIDADQHALVGSRVDAEGGPAHAGQRVFGLDRELLLALDGAGHFGPDVSEEEPLGHPALGDSAAEVCLGEQHLRVRAEAERAAVGELELEARVVLGGDAVALRHQRSHRQRRRGGLAPRSGRF